MSIGQVSSIGPQTLPQQVQPAVQPGGGADLASSAAGSSAAAASNHTTAASQSSSITSTSASQSLSYTSASSQATSFFGTPQAGSMEEQLIRLVVALMLLDELLNGERGSDEKMAMLGMALGLTAGGAGQSMSAMSYSSSYESLSITQQSSVTSATATAAYGGATGDPSAAADAGQQLDINA